MTVLARLAAIYQTLHILLRAHGSVVVKALRYKPEGCGFDIL
jgi:hypothetical protein